MIALVGNDFLNFAVGLRFVEVCLSGDHRVFDGPCIGTIAAIHFRRHNDLGLQVDRVFRLVFQIRAAIFHLANAGVRVGLAHPVFVADLLVLAAFIETTKLFVIRIGCSQLSSKVLREFAR